MLKFSIVFLSFLLLASKGVNAQETVPVNTKPDKLTVGLGIGYDYGDYGANVIYYPQRSIGVFGAVGYAVAGVGYNVGVKLRVLANKSTTVLTPFVMGMYGYFAEASPSGLWCIPQSFLRTYCWWWT